MLTRLIKHEGCGVTANSRSVAGSSINADGWATLRKASISGRCTEEPSTETSKGKRRK